MKREILFLSSSFPDLYLSQQKKSHAREIAWLKSPVRHRTLAPFGGITHIRFKGSSNWTSQPLRLPRIFFLGQIKTQLWEVNRCICCAFRRGRGNPRAQCLQPNCQRETIPRLVPVSRSCERSPAILPCFSSRQSRRCKFRFGPCRRTCLRLPLCTSSHMYPGQQVSLCSH